MAFGVFRPGYSDRCRNPAGHLNPGRIISLLLPSYSVPEAILRDLLDSHLFQRGRQGDPAALGEIYDCLYPTIFRYIYYRVSDQAMAEDLVAEVFVRMVERTGSYQERERPSWPGCTPSPATC